jgi:hypothetical protein
LENYEESEHSDEDNYIGSGGGATEGSDNLGYLKELLLMVVP